MTVLISYTPCLLALSISIFFAEVCFFSPPQTPSLMLKMILNYVSTIVLLT